MDTTNFDIDEYNRRFAEEIIRKSVTVSRVSTLMSAKRMD